MNSVHDGIKGSAVMRILLVEDDLVDQLAFKRFVSEQHLPCDLFVAGSVAEATVALDNAKFDLIIVDYSLGDGTALDVLARVKETPVIITTGAGNEEIAVNALKAGAYDYLVKDLDRNYLKVMPITIENTIRRHRAEERIKKFYSELEVKVQERTQELAKINVSLQEALVLAEAGAKARGEFLANITHELSTPLNSIIGFSQVLLDGLSGELNDKQREYVGAILRSGERLHEAYGDIIQIARLESGHNQLHIDRFQLKGFLEAAVQEEQVKAARQGVILSLLIDAPPETEIEADRGKLRQVMVNLLDNAVKFTAAGGSVTVVARLQSDADFVEISFTDTGIGIKPEDMTRLFKPFQQLESPYTKKYKGVGLGLLLARKLVDLHGGSIWVESEFGKGSTFRFTIPMRQASQG